MLKPLLAAGALAAAALTPNAAQAAHVTNVVGVNSCAAAASGAGSCTFITTGRTYWLELHSIAQYAWASVTCDPSGMYLFVDVWGPGGGYASIAGNLPPGVCTLFVAVDSGHATAVVS